MLAPTLQSISKGRAAAVPLFDTIDRVPVIDSADEAGLKPTHMNGQIDFNSVSFHYPSRPDVPILKSFSSSFAAGKITALVGSSGSGKSTILSLLERFYDPLPGSTITIDGTEIQKLNIKWLRQQIGLVSQEPTLFATTVRANVEHGLVGSPWENATDEERLALVQKACVTANADGFISKLPQGYDTDVGDRGMLLSGGQKQRIAIARAIISNPGILLLDEATSALDVQSERVVQEALDKASVGRTTIVVAHRLSTIRNADNILVLRQGEVIEEGRHEDLIELGGLYATLVNNQKVENVPDDHSEDAHIHDGSLEKEATIANVSTADSSSPTQAGSENTPPEKQASSTPINLLGAFRRVLEINRPFSKWYAVGTISAIAAGMVYPAMSILFGKAIADFELPADTIRAALDRKAFYYLAIAILSAICRFFNFWAFARAGYELAATLRQRLFKAILGHDIEWFDQDKNAPGVLVADLSLQPQNVQGLFGVTLGAILSALTTLVGGCIIGLAYGPLLSLIGIACIPLIISSGYIRLRVVVNKEQQTKQWHAKGSRMASEAAAAVRTVASLTREAQIGETYSKSLEESMSVSNRVAIRSQAWYAASQGVVFLVISLVFYVGAVFIASGRYTTSMFYTSLTSVIFATLEAGDVFQHVPDASKALSAANSIFEIIDDSPTVDANATEGTVLDPVQVKGHVTLSSIDFRYSTRPNVPVLRGLTIDAPAGKHVALVGPSGCGKSTSIGLLNRFYDPLAGQVTLDGMDIRRLNVASYRSQLALVSQEPTLYTGTIRSNILIGAPDDVSDDQLVQACSDANIHDFIMSLPEGYYTEVGGKGSQLSGVSSAPCEFVGLESNNVAGSEATHGHRTCPCAAPKGPHPG